MNAITFHLEHLKQLDEVSRRAVIAAGLQADVYDEEQAAAYCSECGDHEQAFAYMDKAGVDLLS